MASFDGFNDPQISAAAIFIHANNINFILTWTASNESRESRVEIRESRDERIRWGQAKQVEKRARQTGFQADCRGANDITPEMPRYLCIRKVKPICFSPVHDRRSNPVRAPLPLPTLPHASPSSALLSLHSRYHLLWDDASIVELMLALCNLIENHLEPNK